MKWETRIKLILIITPILFLLGIGGIWYFVETGFCLLFSPSTFFLLTFASLFLFIVALLAKTSVRPSK